VRADTLGEEAADVLPTRAPSHVPDRTSATASHRVSTLLTVRRPERSRLAHISSSLFDWRAVPGAMKQMAGWYEEGKIHRALADVMVQSKSEVIIANIAV
jgi:hypothetical protein